LTLRQLLWMAEGQGRERWGHTATLCALIANANRDPKKHRPFKPADFNPYPAPGPGNRNSPRFNQREPDTQGLQFLREALEAAKHPTRR
jgi:hypothetical protein